MRRTAIFGAALMAAALLVVPAARAAEEVNVYTGRHYEGDQVLYDGFTAATGIKVNVLEGSTDEILQRLELEGETSPADVFITVDAGNLWRAEQKGLFQPVESQILNERIPASLRHPDGLWFGLSTRARVFFVRKEGVDVSGLTDYASLADPRFKGQVCIRSGTNVYNLSLLASIIEDVGEAKAEEWAKGVVANMARKPQGGDTDQLKAAASGECAIAVSNTYYYVRLAKSQKPEDQEVAQKLAIIWPGQGGKGAHVNVSGAGVVKHAPHRENAVKFLEYLAGNEAQAYFANTNNEYPAVAAAEKNPALEALGTFKADPVNVAVYGKNQPLAQAIMDRAGWQ